MSDNQSPSDSSGLLNELAQAENVRNICSNTVRLLKESKFDGSVSWQVAQAIDFIGFMHRNSEENIKNLKQRIAQSDEKPKAKRAPKKQQLEAVGE
jgi:hypothetical protein